MSSHPSEETLLDYACGDLPHDIRRDVEDHLEDCRDCRTEVLRTRDLFGDLGALPKELFPVARPSIERADRPDRSGSRPRWWASPTWRAAAAIAFLVAGALSVLLFAPGFDPRVAQGGADDPPSESATLQEAVAGYRSVTEDLLVRVGPTASDPDSPVAIVLASLNRAVADTEQALQEVGSDPVLEEMLIKRYEQRIEMLRQALEEGAE